MCITSVDFEHEYLGLFSFELHIDLKKKTRWILSALFILCVVKTNFEYVSSDFVNDSDSLLISLLGLLIKLFGNHVPADFLIRLVLNSSFTPFVKHDWSFLTVTVGLSHCIEPKDKFRKLLYSTMAGQVFIIQLSILFKLNWIDLVYTSGQPLTYFEDRFHKLHLW